jgi:GDP-L-fucose synthase
MSQDHGTVYVAGHRGLVGSGIARALEAQGRPWVGRTRTELDLTDRPAVFDFVAQQAPEAVVIAAAKVGGIAANDRYPVEFLAENLQIQTNLMDASHAAGVARVLFLGSSCIYPKFAPQPIHEDSLLTGPLEPTNDAYAIAKIAGIRLVDAYRSQYGRHWISAMPTNLYGPGDNFDLETSHVLPALLHRFHDAVRTSAPSVTLWGDGSALREFLHVDDMASAALFLLDDYDEKGPINVGFGSDVTVRQLAELIATVTGYEGETCWDTLKPNGTPRKILDSGRLRSLGWTPKIDLETGVRATYEWYVRSLDRP